MSDLIYLATPYSSPNPYVRLKRFMHVNRFAAELMREGKHVFSPISHTHPIAEQCALPTDWEFWRKYDEVMLSRCQSLVVLKVEGWETSKGVRAEMKIAKRMGLPIHMV